MEISIKFSCPSWFALRALVEIEFVFAQGKDCLTLGYMETLVKDLNTGLVFVSCCHSKTAGRAFVRAGVKHVVCTRCLAEVSRREQKSAEVSRNQYESTANRKSQQKSAEVSRSQQKSAEASWSQEHSVLHTTKVSARRQTPQNEEDSKHIVREKLRESVFFAEPVWFRYKNKKLCFGMSAFAYSRIELRSDEIWPDTANGASFNLSVRQNFVGVFLVVFQYEHHMQSLHTPRLFDRAVGRCAQNVKRSTFRACISGKEHTRTCK